MRARPWSSKFTSIYPRLPLTGDGACSETRDPLAGSTLSVNDGIS
jgi:hypothetical protein